MSVGFSGRRALASLVPLFICLVSGCDDQGAIPEPDIDLDALSLPFNRFTDEACGGAYVTVKEGKGSGSDSRTRHATNWWRSKLGTTSEGCTLGQYAGFYGDAARAEEAFGEQSPDRHYAKTWPWKPNFVDAPDGLNADRTELICLDGAPVTGCTEWYYWAQYGDTLAQLSMSHLSGAPPRIRQGEFMQIVRAMDTQIHDVLNGS